MRSHSTTATHVTLLHYGRGGGREVILLQQRMQHCYIMAEVVDEKSFYYSNTCNTATLWQRWWTRSHSTTATHVTLLHYGRGGG